MSTDQKAIADELLKMLMRQVGEVEKKTGKKIPWEAHLPPGPPRTYSLAEITEAVKRGLQSAGVADQLVHLA